MRSLLIISLILACCNDSFADVAPDPGYTNVAADLILESEADLSGFRFFLESPMGVEEIKIASVGLTVLPAQGRGGAGRYVKLIAVPVDDMAVISGDLSGGLLDNLIRERRFPNARELLSHNFQATVPVFEKPVWKPPVYTVRIQGAAIVAEKSESGGARAILPFLILVAVGGVLLTIGIAIIGIWLFRRSRANP